MSVTEDSGEAILVSAKKLEWVTCIQYLIVFQDGVTQDGSALNPMSALFDSGNEVNAIYPTYAEKVDLVMRSTNVNT